MKFTWSFVDKIGLGSILEVFIDGADKVRNLWTSNEVCRNVHSFLKDYTNLQNLHKRWHGMFTQILKGEKVWKERALQILARNFEKKYAY